MGCLLRETERVRDSLPRNAPVPRLFDRLPVDEPDRLGCRGRELNDQERPLLFPWRERRVAGVLAIPTRQNATDFGRRGADVHDPAGTQIVGEFDRSS